VTICFRRSENRFATPFGSAFEHGGLTLELPKSAASRRRKIEIGGGSDRKRIESGVADGRKAG